MMDIRQLPIRKCPECGSFHTEPQTPAANTGVVIGGMAGAAIVVLRIIGRSSPIVATVLLAGGLVGFLWGAQAGRAIGTEIDQLISVEYRCRSCGAKFNA